MSSWNDNLAQKVERISLAGPSTGGFWANVEIIRPAAWVIAAILGGGFEVLLYFVAFRAEANAHGPMPLALKIFLGIVAPLFTAVMVLLHGYIYADAKRRGMRAVMWTILSVLVPYLIGSILYFLLREPMPTACPKCGYMVRKRFAFCPQCSTPLNRVCVTCSRSLEQGWASCPYCGTAVTGPVAGAKG
jgi:RNA polymerase subunit RPABC4/transcription elongation factor Spt4